VDVAVEAVAEAAIAEAVAVVEAAMGRIPRQRLLRHHPHHPLPRLRRLQLLRNRTGWFISKRMGRIVRERL
jgi:hypothetical protein